ncbi:MAG TPA: hypothetical protein VKT53_12975 [Candidatus Acidoferrum sp.]|nr:hypothetical protein [Candidatus Acidoferrum sp.]
MKRGGLAIALVIVLTGALRWVSPSSTSITGSDSSSGLPATPNSQSSAEVKKSGGTPAKRSHGHTAEGIEDALFAYFGADLEQELSVEESVQLDLYEHWFVPRAERPSTRFAIAILPDPAHTQLNLYFDRGIEAIEQAAQESGYNFDRATMPWDLDEHPESSDVDKREEEAAKKALREKYPGLLIFRHTPPSASADNASSVPSPGSEAHTLLVFVVGEAPTGGIRKDQFAHALQIMKAIAPAAEAAKIPAQKKLAILGPTFSGSLPSLSTALWQDRIALEGKTTLIFSGIVRGTKPRCAFEANLPPGAFFIPFQDNESHLLDQFFHFATKTAGYDQDDIAILSEDETAYGVAPPGDVGQVPANLLPAPDTKGKKIAVQSSLPASPSPSRLDPSCSVQKWDSRNLLSIQFPRGISQFRSAYVRQTGLASAQKTIGQGKPVLPLDLEATGSEDDTVAPYAKAQFPLSQEAVMLGIIGRLHQRHPRLIVLRSSDPVDQLFLARYLRQNFPEARIVIASPDLLFTREDDGLLHGILGISSYPLVPDVEPHLTLPVGSALPQTQRAFPSTNDLGIYNAFVALLAAQNAPDSALRTDGNSSNPQPDLPLGHFVDYGSFNDWRADAKTPQHHLYPDDWITILGRDGFWPLVALPNDAKSGLHSIAGTPQLPSLQKDEVQDVAATIHTSRPWFFLYSIILLALFIHSLIVWFASIFESHDSAAVFGAAETASDAGRKKDPDPLWKKWNNANRRRRSALLAIGTFDLFFILEALVGVRFAAVSETEGRSITFVFSVLPLFCVALVAAHLFFRRGSRIVALVLSSIAVATILLVNADDIGPAYWMTSLSAYRAMHLTSGVSPLLPIIFLFGAGYCLMWFELQGLSVTDCRRPRLPSRADAPTAYVRVTEEETAELHRVSVPLTVPWRILKAILCLVPLLVLTIHKDVRPVLSMEGAAYDRWYAILLFFSLAVFLGCLFRLRAIWNECRRLLGGLDSLPLREAFGRLQDFSWSLLWSPSGSTMRDAYKLVSRELECLGRLELALRDRERSGCPELSPESAKTVNDALADVFSAVRRARAQYNAAMELREKKCFWILRSDHPEAAGRMIREFALVQKLLARFAGILMKEILVSLWAQNLSPVASSVPREARGEKKPFQRIAEEYVSLVYANFLTSILLRMRTLVMESVGIYLFLLLSISFYPFEPNPAMFTLGIVLILAMALIIGFVYSQMHKDAVLSRLTSTTEGELGADFWMQFIGAGAVPVLSLLAVQFPAVSRIITGLLEPALQSVK